jgi:hypothetical protein
MTIEANEPSQYAKDAANQLGPDGIVRDIEIGVIVEDTTP